MTSSEAVTRAYGSRARLEAQVRDNLYKGGECALVEVCHFTPRDLLLLPPSLTDKIVGGLLGKTALVTLCRKQEAAKRTSHLRSQIQEQALVHRYS
jgi:hypothetical protein